MGWLKPHPGSVGAGECLFRVRGALREHGFLGCILGGRGVINIQYIYRRKGYTAILGGRGVINIQYI